MRYESTHNRNQAFSNRPKISVTQAGIEVLVLKKFYENLDSRNIFGMDSPEIVFLELF